MTKDRLMTYTFAALSILGGFYAIRTNHSWIPIIIWACLHWLAYTVMNVSGYFWYYAILIPGIVVATGLGLEVIRKSSLHQTKHPISKHRLSWMIPVFLLVSLFIGNMQNIFNILEKPDQRSKVYQSIGNWLDSNTPEDAEVAALEVGMIGYYSQRAMIDFAGLINPLVSSQFSKDATYEDTAIFVFDRYEPDYLVLQKGMFPKFENNFVFRNCQIKQQFLEEEFNAPGTFEIYGCIYN